MRIAVSLRSHATSPNRVLEQRHHPPRVSVCVCVCACVCVCVCVSERKSVCVLMCWTRLHLFACARFRVLVRLGVLPACVCVCVCVCACVFEHVIPCLTCVGVIRMTQTTRVRNCIVPLASESSFSASDTARDAATSAIHWICFS